MMCSSEPVCLQLPVFENRFTSGELDELLSFMQSAGNDSDGTSRGENQPVYSNSGSEDVVINRVQAIDERKRKRKMSNRESARRSRWRKKRHMEDLTVQVNRLKALNREYKNRLRAVLYQLDVVKKQNDRFRLESMWLYMRNLNLNRVLQTGQVQFGGSYFL